MFQSLANHSTDIKQLLDEGYSLEVRGGGGFLLIHHIPYVNASKKICYGILVSELKMGPKDKTEAPSTHQIYFKGDFPCNTDGTPIQGIGGRDQQPQTLFDEFVVNFYFSNKPHGKNGYDDYYQKVVNYANIISAPAKAIDNTVTEKFFKPIFHEVDSVFEYYDLNSSRANIIPLTDKLKGLKVAILGTGGTGSYILDFLSKTPVQEIHIFDGDYFFMHNAFRAPGAASVSMLDERLKKVAYFHRIYSQMHKHVIPHDSHISFDLFPLLDEMSFVFVAIDKGIIKKELFPHLIAKGIPFVDVGMSLGKTKGDQLTGHLRVTSASSNFHSHLQDRVTMDDPADNIYNSNIQIAEINALNAAFAIIKFKKFFGFYLDLENEHHLDYTLEFSQLLNNDIPTQVC